MAFTKEIKLEIVKTYWLCGGSITAARRLLQKNDRSTFGKLDDRAIRRLVKKLETDFSLLKNTSEGRPRSALSDKNIAWV